MHRFANLIKVLPWSLSWQDVPHGSDKESQKWAKGELHEWRGKDHRTSEQILIKRNQFYKKNRLNDICIVYIMYSPQ